MEMEIKPIKVLKISPIESSKSDAGGAIKGVQKPALHWESKRLPLLGKEFCSIQVNFKAHPIWSSNLILSIIL